MSGTLEAQHLRFAYGTGGDVLDDVSAVYETGELVGLVGPNGAGKSTLLRVLTGMLEPRSGSVLLDGRPVRHMSRRERARHISFLPQIVNPAFSLTVFEVVGLGRFPHLGPMAGLTAHDRRVVLQALEDTDTLEFRDRPFQTLSGGERQRVLLASVLVQEARFVLLDEPASALDLHHQVEVFSRLARFAKQGLGIAVVTHDLNLAARFCKRVILLAANHGVLADGLPDDVLTEALLTRAYGWPIQVARHPILGTPLVSAGAEETRTS